MFFQLPNNIYSPPPSEIDNFPLSRCLVFQLWSWPFCLNYLLLWIYFTLLRPLFSFSYLLLPFSFLFLHFSFTFSLFLSSAFHIFSPNDIGWYSPLGGVIFPCPFARGYMLSIGCWKDFNRVLSHQKNLQIIKSWTSERCIRKNWHLKNVKPLT
jgi:hypothetical protein